MGTRRKSRELVLQMLFQADMGKQTPDVVRKTFWAERSNVEEEVRGFADDLFRVASDRLPEIDGLIGKHTQHWRMERMATVDRNVLRGAVAEFPNAWIKEKLGLRKFSVRGLGKARCELMWSCLTYNIMQWVRLVWRQPVTE